MPARSKAQFRAMQAAAHGHGTIGIPPVVARRYLKYDVDVKALPERLAKKKGSKHREHRVRSIG